MGMGITGENGNGNGREWESTSMGMGMTPIPMGICSHRPFSECKLQYLARTCGRRLVPRLFKVACMSDTQDLSRVTRVPCVPASSSASERVFSTAGRLLEKRRTNLSPADSTNSLLFLHSYLQIYEAVTVIVYAAC